MYILTASKLYLWFTINVFTSICQPATVKPTNSDCYQLPIKAGCFFYFIFALNCNDVRIESNLKPCSNRLFMSSFTLFIRMKASLVWTSMKCSKSNPKPQKLLLNTFAFQIPSYLSVSITQLYFKHYQGTLNFYPAFLPSWSFACFKCIYDKLHGLVIEGLIFFWVFFRALNFKRETPF